MPYQYIQVGEVVQGRHLGAGRRGTSRQPRTGSPHHRLHHATQGLSSIPKSYLTGEDSGNCSKQFAATSRVPRQQQQPQARPMPSKPGLVQWSPPGGWLNLARAFLPNTNAPMQQRPPTLDGIGQGMLVAYAPGDQPMILPPGQAKKIPKGSTIVLQMHYTPNGKAGEDRSTIGLIFAKEAPKYEVRTRSVANPRFEIPPGASNHEVKAGQALREGCRHPLVPASHALPGQVVQVRNGLPRWQTPATSRRAQVRFQLADDV